tara:strand:- start:28220 stop:28522 length:303 start_codon:yes stop_codon:yes gene_type:complete
MKKKNIKLLAEQIAYLLKDNSNYKEEEDVFLKIEEAAKLIHLSKYTIYGLVHKNTIPYHKRGSRLYFLKSEILNWLKAGKRKDKASVQNEVDEYLLKNQL